MISPRVASSLGRVRTSTFSYISPCCPRMAPAKS
jgi:hypothetical protein